LLGAFIGAFLVQLFFTSSPVNPVEQAPFLAGLALLVFVTVMPGGIGSLPQSWREKTETQPTEAETTREGMGTTPWASRMDALDGGEVVMEAQSVSKRFGGVQAVRDVSLTFEGGQISYICGPSGAGKSTLLRVFMGLLRQEGGRVVLKGTDISGWPPFRRSRHGLALLNAGICVFGALSVRENVWIASHSGGRKSSMVETVCDDTLEETGLAPFATLRADDLRAYERQLLGLAMLLARRPDIALLDDPTSSSGDDLTQVRDLILRLSGSSTVLIAEHGMSLAAALDVPVTVLYRGRVHAYGPVNALQQDTRVTEVYQGRHEET